MMYSAAWEPSASSTASRAASASTSFGVRLSRHPALVNLPYQELICGHRTFHRQCTPSMKVHSKGLRCLGDTRMNSYTHCM